MSDWIKLHRKTRQSVVGRDPNLMAVWCHLLLEANWRDGQLKTGETLRQGDLILSQIKFANEIGVSRQTLRRCLKTLEKCGNIVTKPTSQGTHISLCNWGVYQAPDETSQPATNQRPTSDQPQKKKKQEEKELESGRKTRFSPPTTRDVAEYARSLKYWTFDAEHFVAHHTTRGWVTSNGRQMKDWKSAVVTWQKQEVRFQRMNGQKPEEEYEPI